MKSPNLQVDVTAGWRFCWVVVDAELRTAGFSGTAEGMVGWSEPGGKSPNTR